MSYANVLDRVLQDDSEAQYIVGNYYDKRKNYTQAMKYYQLSAEQNHPIALNHAGWYYQHGYVVERNSAKAFKYYLLSAEQKCLLGYSNVGWCYETGYGVQKDLKKALEYYYLHGNICYIAKCELLILKQFSETLNETDYLYAYPLYVKHKHKDLSKLKTLLNAKYIEAMYFMPSVLSGIIISFIL